ncbi:MAG: hypothetical protein Q8Q05_02245 [bacterium]|nr:hypothetical protein [bacterium]
MDIMPPDNQLPPHHAPTGLKLWLAVFGVVLVIALGYLVWAQNTAPDTTDNSAATVKKTATTSDETADWKTHSDIEFSFYFKYPPTWVLDKRGTDYKDPDCPQCDYPPYVSVKKTSEIKSPHFFVAPKGQFDRGLSNDYTTKEITVSGKVATAYTFRDDKYPTYIAFKDMNAFRVELLIESGTADDLETLKKIFDTLVFTK